MAGILYTVAALCVAVSAAQTKPAPPAFFSNQQPQHKYVFDFADDASYYNQAVQKQDFQTNPSPNIASGRLETFEDPNNQVEIIQPQQSPQQPSAAAPNVPGIAPGQRVYIVHMPVPGYRPGTIGGYQPVYVVAAAPANNGVNVPGYQQGPIYQQEGGVPQGAQFGTAGVQQPAFVFHGLHPQNQGFLVQTPYNVYQEQLVYQPIAAVPVAPGPVQHQNHQGVRLNHYMGLHQQPQSQGSQAGALHAQPAAESKRDTHSTENKEALKESRRSARPESAAPAQAPSVQGRPKL